MKKTTIILFFLVFGAFTFAQNINFPDVNFKNFLINITPSSQVAKGLTGNYVSVDTNSDGEISFSEALNIRYFDFSYAGGILSYDGIRNFSNLENLKIISNNISSLDLHDMPLLKYLDYSGNTLSNINIMGNIGLLEFSVQDTFNISSVNFSTNTNLQKIRFYYTSIATLDVSNLPNLTELNLQMNGYLSSINVSGCFALNKLEASGSVLTSLNLNGLTNLTHTDVHNNEFTTLNFNLQTNLNYLNISQNFSLSSLYIKNGAQETLSFQDTPLLTYICCDSNQITTVQNSYGYNQSCIVDSACDAVLGVEGTNPYSESVIVYPNPVKDFLNFKFSGKSSEIEKIELYDLSGKMVKQFKINLNHLDLSDLVSGQYFIKVQLKNNEVYKKKVYKK